MRRLAPKAMVTLKSDPTRRGVVLQVGRGGRTACVQFENYPRPTVHAVEGLVLLSPQLDLFEEGGKRIAS